MGRCAPVAARIFVYGSLMRGQHAHALLAGASFVRTARTADGYTLIDLGAYPGLVDGGAGAVAGEVYEVDAALLARLDAYEDHPTLFWRRLVRLEGGDTAEAYFTSRVPAGAVPVASGDWRTVAADRNVLLMSLRPSGVHHVALEVTDLAAAERFYAVTLGLPVLRRWPSPDGQDRSVWLDLGDGSFLALERTPAPRPSDDGPGWHLVALRIRRDDRTSWVERLAGAGFALERQSPYTIYVRDPEGNRVGLSHWPDSEQVA